MKGLLKKLSAIIACMLAVVCCCSFMGCATESTALKVTVNVYDPAKGAIAEHTMIIDLYGTVAPKTVNAIKKYALEGYYNDMTFYTMTSYDGSSAYSGHVMFGDYTYNSATTSMTLEQKDEKPFLDGEFAKAGTTGSNLKNTKGTIGIWRTWQKGDSYKTNNWANTGKATCYINNTENTDYDGNFTVFAKIRISDATTAATWSKIYSACNNASITSSFVIFYTEETIDGVVYEYTDDDSVKNNGLKFNCLPLSDFEDLTEEDREKIFYSEEGEYVKYNESRVKIPMYKNAEGVKVSAATIKSVTAYSK